MRLAKRRGRCWQLALLVAPPLMLAACGSLRDTEQVTIYPSYGHRVADGWTIPLRLWVHEPRALEAETLTRVGQSVGQLAERERANLRARLSDLVADDESRQRVELGFDGDSEARRYLVIGAAGDAPESDLDGLIEGHLLLTETKARELLKRQGSSDGWLTLRVVSRGHRGAGRVRLIGPRGLSVVSDIDDTIKVTELPAGKRVVMRNTFSRDFVAADGMAARYASLEGAAFHYVSGGPWQLYRPLSEFLFGEGGFPPGSVHMKSVRKNPLGSGSWQDLAELVAGGATVAQKLAQIGRIIEDFPEREFILVGDSGEHDPEVYRQLRERFPERVREIWIRDVVNARRLTPARLEGMQVIEAPTITRAP